MMFFNFLNLILSYDNQCVAPHISPPPVSDMEILYVQVLLRHGARTPMNAYGPFTHRGYWLCDSDDAYAPRMHGAPLNQYRRFKHVLDPRLVEFLPNCRAGDLLLEGMAQHHRLGQFYHKYLFETLHLFEDDPKTEELYVRCSDIERTLRSVQSFLHGFYPPPVPNTIIDIFTGSEDLSLLRPNNAFCKDLSETTNSRNQDPDFLNFFETNWDNLINLSTQLNIDKSIDNLNLMCDWVSTQYCDDKLLPSFVTPEIQQQCLKVIGNYLYKTYSRNPYVYGSYTMREILRVANNSLLNKNKVKFTINSAHDSTIATIVRLLNYNHERIPPYASHLLMEIYKDKSSEKWIRFALNGELIQLREMENKTIVKYNDFLKSNYMEIYNYCKELP